MPIKLDALKAVDKQLKKEGGGGSSLLFKSKDLGEEQLVRLAPVPVELNGVFALKVKRYWINNKPVIALSTFKKEGRPLKDVIADEVEMARADGDSDVLAILEDEDRFKEETMYLCGLFLLEEKSGGRLIVVDNMCKIMEMGVMLYTRMNKLCMSRLVQNGTEEGIADRELGYNMVLSKTGKKMTTKYDAQLAEQYKMPAALYQNIPNVYEYAKASAHTAAYSRALIRELLYGEEIPDELDDADEKRKTKLKEYFKQYRPVASAKPATKDADEEEDDEEEETPKKKAIGSRPAPPKKKPREEEYEDADEEEEAPVVKKKPVKKVVEEDDEDLEWDVDEALAKAAKKTGKKVVQEEDDEDLEEEAPKPKKKAAAPLKPKRRAADEINDSLDD